MTKGQKKNESAAPRPRYDVEVEVKLKCESLDRLTASGLETAPVEDRHFEDNWVYELPDGKLRKGQYLRVRYAGDGDGAGRRRGAVLTYKGKSRRPNDGPKGKNKGKKVREEIETSVGQPTKVVKILKRLGLRRSFRYQKYRSVYGVRLEDGRALLAMFDETPIGNFLELEGDAEVIEAVAARLGYAQSDYLASSYVEMQLARCIARGEPLSDMVFTDGKKKAKPAAKKAAAKRADGKKTTAKKATAKKAAGKKTARANRAADKAGSRAADKAGSRKRGRDGASGATKRAGAKAASTRAAGKGKAAREKGKATSAARKSTGARGKSASAAKKAPGDANLASSKPDVAAAGNGRAGAGNGGAYAGTGRARKGNGLATVGRESLAAAAAVRATARQLSPATTDLGGGRGGRATGAPGRDATKAARALVRARTSATPGRGPARRD